MYLLIDNYDSFTYILHHYLLQTGHECVVYRNDEISLQDIDNMHPERIIISPGPETPLQAGITMDVLARYHNSIPILGVCLGHQAIGMFFGGKLMKVPPMHGKTSLVAHNAHPLFTGIPDPFTVMRYHSLAIDASAAGELEVLATSSDGVVMALAHRTLPCMGVQFHPESVGTEHGLTLLRNWAQQPLKR